MVNFNRLAAKISCRVWGSTTANFNGFRVLASLLHRCRSTEVNQTLHNVWPSHGLVHYIYIFGLLPLTEFCQVQNLLCIQVLLSPILTVLLHGTRPVGVSQTAAFSRGCHLYLAGRSSCWPLAHILVNFSCNMYLGTVCLLCRKLYILLSTSSSLVLRCVWSCIDLHVNNVETKQLSEGRKWHLEVFLLQSISWRAKMSSGRLWHSN